jgi:hypothetical protein
MKTKNTLDIAEYLARNILTPLIQDGRLILPRQASDGGIPEEIMQQLSASITNNLSPIASVSHNYVITLPAGFLCRRWCSVFRLAEIYSGKTYGLENYKCVVDIHGSEYVWPRELPAPNVVTNPVVCSVNAIFAVVLMATVLHEIGHAVLGKPQSPEVELECDAYAMKYLLEKCAPNEYEMNALAVAIWICCLCDESLYYDEHNSATHPNAVQRMLQFAKLYLVPDRGNDAISKIELFCVGHIINLGRIRRGDETDRVCARNHTDLMELLHDMQACW